MGVIIDVVKTLVGGSGGVAGGIKDVAEVFTPNAEASDQRASEAHAAALAQFAAEFKNPRVGWFDQVIDGANRLPRPLMALSVIGLFAMAMIDPLWFGERMQGLILVPEPKKQGNSVRRLKLILEEYGPFCL